MAVRTSLHTSVHTSVPAWLRTFVPRHPKYRRVDIARGALGALLGILAASLVGKAVPGGPDALPFIVAPMGASAVLLFAVPASPLAQPWPLMGGNVLSSLVGIGAGRIFDDPMVAAAVAVGAAIALMMSLGCLHPPGGACALFAAVGAPAIHHHGFWFAVWPVGVNSAALLVMAVVVNNLTGRPYPHAPERSTPAQADRLPREKVGVQAVDVERAMGHLDQGFDVMPGDVIALVRDAEAFALDRRLGELRCGSIMVPDVHTIGPTESLYRARVLMNEHRVKALPVVDADGVVLGIVTTFDLFNLDVAEVAPVATVMTSPVTTVRHDAHVAELVALMTDRDLHHVPVVDGDERLVGIITRRELIAILNRALLGSNGEGT